MHLPKFPLRITYNNVQYRALFKPTGVPNKFRVLIKDMNNKLITDKLFNSISSPSDTQAWFTYAKEALNAIKLLSQKEISTDPKPKHPSPVLSSVREGGTQVSAQRIVYAKDLDRSKGYITAHPDHPQNRFFTRFEQVLPSTRVRVWVLIKAYHQSQWKVLDLPPTYPFVEATQEEFASRPPLEARVAMKSAIDLQLKKESLMPKPVKSVIVKPRIYPSWGQAFVLYATKPNAPALIAEHMKKTFPEKPTKWLKWVNTIRSLYNKADPRLGTKAPANLIPVYKTETKQSAKPKTTKNEPERVK
jgi:hypothetical protein